MARVELTLTSSWRPSEYFKLLIPTLEERGFIHGGSHHIFDPLPGTASCYGYMNSKELPCTCQFSKVRRIYVSEKDRELLELFPVFFDWDDSSFHYNHPCRIEVFYKELFLGVAGIYCKRLHLLHATDWTHKEEFIPLAKKIVTMLPKKRVTPKAFFRREKITIGCDPEFEQLVSENVVIRQDLHQNINTPDGEVGIDGAGDQIELRPIEDRDHRKVIARIRRLIKAANRNLGVKGDVYPLGCHIHLGLPYCYRTEQARTKITRILDDFLGRKLLPLSGRARGDYRKLGAYRDQPWGIEYRTLPSAVLWSPEFGRIVFKIAKNAVQKFVNERKLEYSDLPTKEDYLRICKLTPEEYEKFILLCREYKTYKGEAINANWGIKNVVAIEIQQRSGSCGVQVKVC